MIALCIMINFIHMDILKVSCSPMSISHDAQTIIRESSELGENLRNGGTTIRDDCLVLGSPALNRKP